MQDRLTIWFSDHFYLLGSIAMASLAMLALSVFIAPWLISKLPDDYLLRSSAPLVKPIGMRILIGAIRNLMASALFLTGLIMLVAPGPGLIMLLLAVSVAQVPGKQQLIRRIATHKRVFQSLNWMRRHHKKPPFKHPDS